MTHTCLEIPVGMASLAVGSFLDDGALPKRDVVATADGGFTATVGQGAPALALWAALPSIQRLRGEPVRTTTCRGGGGFTGSKVATQVLKCRVEGDGGPGFKPGPVECKGPGGLKFVGSVTAAGGKVLAVEPLATGAAIVGTWKPGIGFAIEQDGSSRPAAGMVVDVVLGLGGKTKRHKYLAGDVIAVKDVNSAWMSNRGRRPNHLVRKRELTCQCRPSCTVRVEELYSHRDVTHGTVQVTVYNQSDHDVAPPEHVQLPGKGNFGVS